MLAILVTGSIFYFIVEGWSIIDSIYFCVMTIATVGYGDFSPSTALSKLFTITLALSGIGVFVGIVTKLAQSLAHSESEKRNKLKLKIDNPGNKKTI